MAKRKDSEAASHTARAKPASASAEAPLTVDTPKIEVAAEQAKIELPKIELRPVDLPKREPLQLELSNLDAAIEPAPAMDAEPLPRPSWHRMVMAASLVGTAFLGALAGAAATVALRPAAPASNGVEEIRAVREMVVRLNSELTTLKASVDTANRTSAAQAAKLADRFDRAEKAQAEPASKLARMAESLDRLERRTTVAAAPPVAPAAAEVTGAVTAVEKQQGKPPLAEGWRLREFFAGRALVESRSFGLYEVGPGSNLPGLGKVETIKREDGRVIVVTPKGIITSSLDPRRPPPYQFAPHRY